MQIRTKATNIELTPAISSYINKKFSAFERFMMGDTVAALADVEVGKTTNHHRAGEIFRAEVNLHVSGEKFFAASEKEDLFVAIDDVKDEIIRELTNHKDKSTTLMRKGALKIKQVMKGFDPRTWKN